MEDEEMVSADGETKGCAYCGGLGHSIISCPKLEREKMTTALGGSGPNKDFTRDSRGMAAYGAEM